MNKYRVFQTHIMADQSEASVDGRLDDGMGREDDGNSARRRNVDQRVDGQTWTK